MTARIAAAAAGAMLAVALAPAAAQAATLAPLKPCYVTAGTAAAPQRQGFQVSAGGFSVNARVDLTIDGQPLVDANGQVTSLGLQADAGGNLVLPDPVPVPWIQAGMRDFTITLTEQGNPANTVSATAKVAALSVNLRPKVAPPSKRIRFRGRGFTLDKPVFAHYLYSGKLRRTVRLTKRTGMCGTFSARKRQIPVRYPAHGLWMVQFDQQRRFATPAELKKGAAVRVAINVRLVRD